MQRRLLRWLPAVVAPVVVAGAITVPLVAAAAAPDLAPKTPAQVLQLVADADTIAGFTGTVEQHSDLGLPSIPSMGASSGTGAGAGTDTASVLDLLTGTHTARVEVAGKDRARVAVLDDSAERDVVANGRSVWVWSSKANTALHVTASGTAATPRTEGTMPTPAEAAKALLAKVDGTTDVSVDATQRVAGRDAYTLVLTPRTSATTVGSVRIAVDATTGLPLDVQVLARGASSPAFETGFTQIDYTVPAASRFDFTPPTGAKVTTKTLTPGEHPQGREAGPAKPRPTVDGAGWASVVSVAAGSAQSELASNPTVRRLTTAVAGGRVLHTALLNVLLTDDGRVLAGAVPVSRLQSAAG